MREIHSVDPRLTTSSEGIYFVVRLPKRWQLLAFRFDDYHEGGHPEFWEAHVTPVLVKAWAFRLFPSLSAAERCQCELQLKAELDLHYDGFPRGRVTWNEEIDRFAVFHGSNLKPTMKLQRGAIERAFGISGRADWEFDEHEQCSLFSAEAIWTHLPIRERWKTAIADFD